jgi:hypothetical protein
MPLAPSLGCHPWYLTYLRQAKCQPKRVVGVQIARHLFSLASRSPGVAIGQWVGEGNPCLSPPGPAGLGGSSCRNVRGLGLERRG